MEWIPQASPGAPTAREQELIVLIARGLQNKVIAHELQISANTVRAHIGNIMRKYKLHNRTQIAMTLAPRLNGSWPQHTATENSGDDGLAPR